jgi:hypothetical protein
VSCGVVVRCGRHDAATDVSVPNGGGNGFFVTATVVSFRLADGPPDFAVQTFIVFLPGALPADARRAHILGQLRILVGGRFGVDPNRVDAALA